MKPGYTTTEFWVSLLTTLVGAGIAIAALLGHNLDGSNLQPIIGLAGLLASGLASAFYSHSRGAVKTAVAYASVSPVAAVAPPPADPPPAVAVAPSPQTVPVVEGGGA